MAFGYGNSRRSNPNSGQTDDRNPSGKRAKHVLGTREIAHAWAHPLERDGSGFYQTHARNPQGNLYYRTATDGTRTLFSYRDSYPIGSVYNVTKKGKSVRVYLVFDDKPYSNTTAQHMSQCRGAVPKDAIHFNVLDVTSSSYGNPKPTRTEHSKNLAYIVSEYEKAAKELKRTHSAWRIKYRLESTASLREHALAYARFFGLKAPKLEAVPVFTRSQLEKAKAFDAGATERRERTRATRAARWEAQRAQWEQQRKEEAENAKRTLPERIAKWRQGQYVGYLNTDYALLRLINCDTRTNSETAQSQPVPVYVETSQGVKVPVSGQAGAARLYRFLKALKEAGKTYRRNGHSEHIGNFTVTSFEPSNRPEGEPMYILEAGCHRIEWREIEELAPALLAAEAQ